MANLSRAAPTGRANPRRLDPAIAPRKQFINGRPATDLIEASPDGKFVKASSNRKGQPLDLALGRPTRYCAA